MNLKKPPPDLGKRVISELCGYETFAALGKERLAKIRKEAVGYFSRTTVTATAKIFGISRAAVYKIAKAFLRGGEAAVEELNWNRGRPIKILFFSQNEIDFMVSKTTLV